MSIRVSNSSRPPLVIAIIPSEREKMLILIIKPLIRMILVDTVHVIRMILVDTVRVRANLLQYFNDAVKKSNTSMMQ